MLLTLFLCKHIFLASECQLYAPGCQMILMFPEGVLGCHTKLLHDFDRNRDIRQAFWTVYRYKLTSFIIESSWFSYDSLKLSSLVSFHQGKKEELEFCPIDEKYTLSFLEGPTSCFGWTTNLNLEDMCRSIAMVLDSHRCGSNGSHK